MDNILTDCHFLYFIVISIGLTGMDKLALGDVFLGLYVANSLLLQDIFQKYLWKGEEPDSKS